MAQDGQAIAQVPPGAQFTLTSLRTQRPGNYMLAVINPAGRVGARTAVGRRGSRSAQITFGLIDYFNLMNRTGSTT